MSATGQPYSDAALRAVYANLEFRLGKRRLLEAGEWSLASVVLDAAHDREALGLEASVHAASYRRELLAKVAEAFPLRTERLAELEAEDVAELVLAERDRYRREVVEEVAARFRTGKAVDMIGLEASRWALEFLLREFGAPDDQ